MPISGIDRLTTEYMLKHIVMWRLKEEAEGAVKEDNAREMKRLLEGLPAMIPEIRRLEVGVNSRTGKDTFDVVLYTEFENEGGLETYLAHQEHERVAAFVSRIRMERAVVDYVEPKFD